MGDSTVSGLMEKKTSRNRKVKIRFFSRRENEIILHVGTNDAPYKTGSDISNEILELMRFIKEEHPDCIRTDNYNANKENESLLVA